MPPLDASLSAPRLEYVSGLLEGRAVLVVGGHGWEAVEALNHGCASALWCDPSAIRVSYVQRRHAGVAIHQAPIDDTGLDDESFDVVIVAAGLNRDEQVRARILKELRRLLHRDGFLVLTEPICAPLQLHRPAPPLEEVDLRLALRRWFPHVELLRHSWYIGGEVGPGERQLPTYAAQAHPPAALAWVAICSQLLILIEEVGLTRADPAPFLAHVRQARQQWAAQHASMQAVLRAVRIELDEASALQSAALDAAVAAERDRLKAHFEVSRSAYETHAAAQLAEAEAGRAAAQDRVEALLAQVTRLTGEVDTLGAAAEERQARIDALQVKLSAGEARLQALKADVTPRSEPRVPDEIWSPPVALDAEPHREGALWSRMLDAVHEAAPADTAWSTPQERQARGGVVAALSLTGGGPTPRRGEGKAQPIQATYSEDDRPQEGELALLDAISAANLARLPRVTEEA